MLAVTAAAILLFHTIFRKKEDLPAVILGHPKIGTIVESVPCEGKIKAVKEISISPDVSGEIIKVAVKEGDMVSKGDLLIKIRPDLYISLLERAEAMLKAARAQSATLKIQMKKDSSDLERMRRLYTLEAVSGMEYENAVTAHALSSKEYENSRYNVSSAEASVREAEDNLKKTRIYSPMDGIVTRLDIEEGERVVGTSQMAGTQMLKISDLDQMELVTTVAENDILKIKIGDSAMIQADAHRGKRIEGKVTGIAFSASEYLHGGEKGGFEVKIAILTDSLPLKPGMSASCDIKTEEKKNILTVPIGAVVARDGIFAEDSAGKGEYLFAYSEKSSTVMAVKVKTGIQNIREIEISEGLESDTVSIVVGPYSAISKELKNGTKVKVE